MRRFIPAMAGGLACAALLALPASSALARAVSVNPPGITVGPLKAANGYTVTLSGSGCDNPYQEVNIVITKTGRDYTISHDYYYKSHKSTCTVSSSLKSGAMSAKWGKLVDIKLKLGHAKGLRKLRYTAKGCTGTEGSYRAVRGHGTVRLSIHRQAFGKLLLHSVRGELISYDYDVSCKSTGPEKSLSTSFGKDSLGESLTGTVPSRGTRNMLITGPDNPGRGVFGSVDDTFWGGSGLVSIGSNLRSAKLGAFKQLLTGSIRFTASGSCSQGYQPGKLSGKLVLHDPASGRLTLRGRSAFDSGVYDTSGSCS